MRLFDTHTHYEDERFAQDLNEIISAFKDNNVEKIITVGSDIDTSKRCIKIADSYKDIYAAAGIHPHEAKICGKKALDAIKCMLGENKVVALGEIGLDYHYDFSPRDKQMECFINQLELNEDIGLPVIYHIREAWGDFLEMLRQNRVSGNAVMHCYSGSKESAKLCLDKGMMISFTGVITFKNAHNIREVVDFVPIDRLMIETDCPYMAPVPYRGKRNESKHVIEVARSIAQVKNMDLEDVCEITYQNGCRFFNPKYRS